MPAVAIKAFRSILPALLLPALAALLSGCGADIYTTIGGGGSNPGTPGNAFFVTVRSGATPIAGATVQLYAAGSTGLGSASTTLLAAALTTDANGTVSIPASNYCPAASSLVYVVGTGGRLGSTGTGAGSVLVTALGPCSGIASGAQYTVSETTSVAAMYSLAPFYTAPTQIGATASNATGLANAFAVAATLSEPTTGAVPGLSLPANVAAPSRRLNTLANILRACVAQASCAALYTGTTVAGSTPANTLDALASLARNPALATASLYAQAAVAPAYTPALTAAPADFTLYVTLSGGGLNTPTNLALDSAGNAWVASYFQTVSKFSPTGAALIPGGITGSGLNNSYGIAVDLTDNAWVTNQPSIGIPNSISRFSPAGTSLAGNGYTAGGLNYPTSIAIDPNGTAWVVDYGNSHVTLLSSSGQPLSGATGYTSSFFAFPVVVAVDGNHFGWIGNQFGATLVKAAPDGSSFTGYSCCSSVAGIAIDQSNNVWAANFFGDSISEISATGQVVSNGAYTAMGALTRPQGIAIDGAGSVWVSNYRQPYINKLAGAATPSPGASLSPVTGYGADAGLLLAFTLSVDSSGGIWVVNQGTNTVTRFLGLAIPVRTPLSGLPKAP